jgi:integration host factor subunit beta
MSEVHKLTSQGGLMNKAELIEKVSRRVRIPSKVAKVVVNTIFDSMRESLEKGEGIEIRGFGSFVVREYGAYKGRNPKTGETVDVPPKKLPYFKVGRELKEKVNTTRGKIE